MDNVGVSLPSIVSCGIYDSSLIYPSSVTETVNRRVSMFELDLPCGNDGVSYIGKDAYAVSPSRLIAAKPGHIRHSALPYKCFFLHIMSDDVFSRLLSGLPDVIDLPDEKRYREHFERIIGYDVRPGTENELRRDSELLMLLADLVRDTSRSDGVRIKTGSSNENVVREAIRYIDTHYAEAVTLADIAGHVHLSEIYFHNLFRRAVGVTPHRYVLSVRIAAAKKLLAASSLPFAEISARCGFGDQSYFHFVFRREEGVTPKEYRTRFSEGWEHDPTIL